MVVVPGLVGMHRDPAKAELEGLLLESVVHPRVSDESELWDIVVAQYPEQGAAVPRGSTVGLTVAVGGRTAYVTDCIGMGAPEAYALFTQSWEGAQTVVSHEPTANQDDWGKVIAQNPPAGTPLDSSTVITLTVGVSITTTTTAKDSQFTPDLKIEAPALTATTTSTTTTTTTTTTKPKSSQPPPDQLTLP
jgi:beta-lactam-binding protein with PASTA domain